MGGNLLTVCFLESWCGRLFVVSKIGLVGNPCDIALECRGLDEFKRDGREGFLDCCELNKSGSAGDLRSRGVKGGLS